MVLPSPHFLSLGRRVPYMSLMQCTTGSLFHSWHQPFAMLCACPHSSGWWQSGWGGCPTASLKLPLTTRTHTQSAWVASLHYLKLNSIQFLLCLHQVGQPRHLELQERFTVLGCGSKFPWRTPELLFQIPVIAYSHQPGESSSQREKLSARLKCIHKDRI